MNNKYKKSLAVATVPVAALSFGAGSNGGGGSTAAAAVTIRPQR